MPQVSAIYLKESKDAPRKAVSDGILRAGYGLEGDCNSGGKPERQLCIMRKEDRDAVEADSRNGLCFERFLETVQIEGLELADLTKGQKLKIGSVEAEITVSGKRCWPECEILQAGEKCAMAKGAAFLAVLTDGEIRTGDKVILL